MLWHIVAHLPPGTLQVSYRSKTSFCWSWWCKNTNYSRRSKTSFYWVFGLVIFDRERERALHDEKDQSDEFAWSSGRIGIILNHSMWWEEAANDCTAK